MCRRRDPSEEPEDWPEPAGEPGWPEVGGEEDGEGDEAEAPDALPRRDRLKVLCFVVVCLYLVVYGPQPPKADRRWTRRSGGGGSGGGVQPFKGVAEALMSAAQLLSSARGALGAWPAHNSTGRAWRGVDPEVVEELRRGIQQKLQPAIRGVLDEAMADGAAADDTRRRLREHLGPVIEGWLEEVSERHALAQHVRERLQQTMAPIVARLLDGLAENPALSPESIKAMKEALRPALDGLGRAVQRGAGGVPNATRENATAAAGGHTSGAARDALRRKLRERLTPVIREALSSRHAPRGAAEGRGEPHGSRDKDEL